MSEAVSRLPVVVVDVALEERGADAVREAAEHLAVREQRVEKAPRVVDASRSRAPSRRRSRGRPRRRRRRRRSRGRRTTRRGPRHPAGRGSASRRTRPRRDPAPCRREGSRGSSAPSRRRVAADASRRRACARIASTFSREPSGRRPAPRRRRRRRTATSSCRTRPSTAGRRGVELGEHVDVRGVARRARRRRPGRTPFGVPGPAASSPSRTVMPPSGVDRDRGALGVPRLRQRPARSLGRLRERDVAHVRDRRLDDAGEPDADEPSLRSCALDASARSSS